MAIKRELLLFIRELCVFEVGPQVVCTYFFFSMVGVGLAAEAPGLVRRLVVVA